MSNILNILSPTRIKLWATLAITVSFWVAIQLGEYLTLVLIRIRHPEFMDAVLQSVAPPMDDAIGATMGQGVMQTGMAIVAIKVASAILVAYVCACILSMLVSKKLISDREPDNALERPNGG